MTDILRPLAAVLICMALVVWSVVPSFGHASGVSQTSQDRLELPQGQGMSEGTAHGHASAHMLRHMLELSDDLHWAMHGHSHDVADHDHSQAFLMPPPHVGLSFAFQKPWRRVVATDGPSRQFRIERPPRL